MPDLNQAKTKNTRPVILQVCESYPPSVGGVELFVANLIQRLSGQFDFRVATTMSKAPYREHKYSGSPGLLQEDFAVRRVYPLGSSLPYIKGAFILRVVLELAKREHVDLVHVHSLGLIHSDLSTLFFKIRDVPVVLTVHGFGEKGWFRVPYYFARVYESTLARATLNMATRIVALTQQGKRYFEDYGIDERKISVIPNGVDFDFYSKEPYENQFKEKWEIEGRISLTVGRIGRSKGSDILIKSARTVLNVNPDVFFVFVGPTNEYQALRKTAEREGVDQRCVFTGPLFKEDLRDAYWASDCYVQPSHREGFPTTVLEAMSARRPVIVSKVGGVVDIVEEGVDGFFLPDLSPSAVSDAIINLLNSPPETLRTIGMRACKKAEKYDWSAIAAQYGKLYLELMNRMEKRRTESINAP